MSASAALQWDKSELFIPAMPSDGKVHAHFAFTNTGSYPVKIKDLKSTCGCTAATSEKRVVAPGEKGEVTVAYKTIGRRGLHMAPITVRTDDPDAPETVLKLRVLIQDIVELQPTFLYWKSDEPASPKTITVKVTDGFDVRQIGASSSDPRVGVKVQTVKAGHEYAVVVTPQAASGTVKAKLEITAQRPSEAAKTFTAYARVR